MAEPGFELCCERLPDEELEPEPGDFLMPVDVRTTVRLEGLELALPVGFALVNVRVKYWMSSISQTEMIMEACMASPSGRGLDFFPSRGGGGRGVPGF